jgi:DNA primase
MNSTSTLTSSDNFKEALKQQADIVRIVGDYVKLKKAGAQNFSGLCPFHAEKTPSFSVHATRQFYHCFGCGESGDVFAFIQKVENITFPEAVRLLAQKLGVPMPKVGFSSPAEARDAQVRMALLDVHVRAAAFFQECLRRPEGANAREYLTGRGLDDETIARFRIGYAPDSGFLLRDALRREFDEELLRESGLFSWKNSSQLSAFSSQEKQVLRSAQDDKFLKVGETPRYTFTKAGTTSRRRLRRISEVTAGRESTAAYRGVRDAGRGWPLGGIPRSVLFPSRRLAG